MKKLRKTNLFALIALFAVLSMLMLSAACDDEDEDDDDEDDDCNCGDDDDSNDDDDNGDDDDSSDDDDDDSTDICGTPIPPDAVEAAYTKMLIEHNATDEDTGFQGAFDADPWNKIDVCGPDGNILTIETHGSMRDVGLTELFYETQEPENALVPIPDWLAKLPAGDYTFRGQSVEGDDLFGVATLTHAIPAGPVITSPPEDAEVDSDADLVITWDPVTETIYGEPVTITHYQLIVEEDVEFDHPGFGRSLYSVHAPASITTMTVPAEFLAPGTEYEFEVLAIEESGNQTLASSAFETE